MEENDIEEQEIEQPKNSIKTTKKTWQILTVVLGILFIISIITAGFRFSSSGNIISSSTVKSTIEELSGASVLSVNEENDLYKAIIKDNEGNEGVLYMSKDGQLLFQGAIDVEKLKEYIASAKDAAGSAVKETKMTCEDITKQDKPLLESFVVSNCPYGVQMQQILVEVAKLFKDNIKVRYIGAIENNKITSMHGDAEATENLRQICIREEQLDKYWEYVKCFIDKKDSKVCLTEAKVDETKLETCMTDTTKGIKYAEEDFKLQDKYQVTGSPTLILNGVTVREFDFGGRNPDAVKTMLCCGFKTTPSDCSKKLATTGTATQGNC